MWQVIFSISYSLGWFATAAHSINDDAERETNTVMYHNGDWDPWWKIVLLIVWTMVIVSIWPVYWAGRALHAPAERLLLPPGEVT